jgi:hypothetical protein
MKTLCKLTLVFWLFLTIFSCQKNEAMPINTKPAENPMAKILEDKTWIQTLSPVPDTWELGYVFSATTNGKITQLGCRLPEPGVYTVSLWELATKKLVRQKAVEQTSPDKFTLANVDELIVEKDKKYVVSVNSTVAGKAKSYFRIANSNANIFPIVRGSILIQTSVFKSSSSIVYPDALENGRMFGYAEFTYIPE